MGGSEPLIPPGLDATLALLRHGETDFIVEGRFQGRLAAELSPLGVRQAGLAAARLAHPHRPPALPVPSGPPRFIAHSPLARTRQVAERVAEAIAEARREVDGREAAQGADLPQLRPEEGLAEIGQGAWEGLLQSEIRERYGDVLSAWRRTPTLAHAPGGESLAEVRERIGGGLRPMLAELAAGGAPGSLDRPQVAGYLETPDVPPPWAILVGHDGNFKVLLLALFDLPLESFWTFPFALCGISVVDIRGGRAALRAHNRVEHLAELEARSPDQRRAEEETARRERSGAL